jgi:hypothetical protein
MPDGWPFGLIGLDIQNESSQNTRNFRENMARPCLKDEYPAQFMMPSQSSQPPKKKLSPDQCKHPRVQIVSRDADSEYVECQECGDVFESSEFKDMAIEELRSREEE